MASPSLAELPSVPKALGIASEKQIEEAAKIQRLYNDLGTSFAESASNVGKGTIAGTLETPETILFRDTEQLKADFLKSNAAAAAGMSPDTAVNVMDIMLRDIRDTGLQMREVSDRLAADKSVSLFDDPLTAIMNAFTIPWTEQELKGLSEKQVNRKKTLDDLTSGVTNTAASAEAVKAKLNAAGIADRQRAIAANAAAEAKTFERAGIQANIGGVQAAMTATKNTLDLSITYNNWINGEETRAFQRLQREIIIEEKTARLKATKDVVLAESQMLKYANLALEKDGLPQFTSVGQLKSRIVTAKEKERIDDLINRGMLLEDPNSMTARSYSHGTSPRQIVEFQNRNKIAPNSPDQSTLMQTVRDALLAGDQAGKSTEDKDLQAGKILKKKLTDLETVKKDDNSNPFRAPTFGTMAMAPSVNTNPVFQKIIAPLITEGNKNQSAHPEIIGAMVAKAVSDRLVSPNQAASFLTYFYTQAALINNENTQVQKLTGYRQSAFKADVEAGIDTPGALTGLGITTGGIFATPFAPFIGGAVIVGGIAKTGIDVLSTKKTYNFMDKTETQAYIIRKVFGNMVSKDQVMKSGEVSGIVKPAGNVE